MSNGELAEKLVRIHICPALASEACLEGAHDVAPHPVAIRRPRAPDGDDAPHQMNLALAVLREKFAMGVCGRARQGHHPNCK